MEQKTPDTCYITIKNKTSEFSQVVKSINKVCGYWKVQSKQVDQLNLAIEEAISNIIFYAYSDKGEHVISIKLTHDNNVITVKITDDGKYFNILEADTKIDILAAADEREIGGLGIYLLKKMVDKVAYKRIDNCNVLILTKKTDHTK